MDRRVSRRRSSRSILVPIACCILVLSIFHALTACAQDAPLHVANLARSMNIVASSRDGAVRMMTVQPSAPVLIDEADRQNGASIQATAVNAVQQLATRLGLPLSATIEPAATHRVAQVWRTSFKLSYHGIPVRDRQLSTLIGATSGKLLAVTSDFPASEPTALTPMIEATSVTRNLGSYFGTDTAAAIVSQTSPSLVYVESGGSLRLCYEFSVRQFGHAWRVTVDAITGKLLERKDMLEYVGSDAPTETIQGTLQAMIHQHSPFDSLMTVGLDSAYLSIDGSRILSDSIGNWKTDATSPLSIVTGFYGRFAHVVRHDAKTDTVRRTLGAPYQILWNDDNSHAAERDAFYHASYARRYAHQIDTGLSAIDSQLTLNVNLDLSCNAFYDADSVALNFFQAGKQCSNSGEVADVIYHEFGHRIAQVRYANGANGNLINFTLGEGFADLTSAFIRDDPRIGIGFYVADSNQILRTCNNTKIFPRDISADPHLSGEIISGAFWDLRKLLGHDTAEKLFNAVEWLNPDAPDETAPDILEQAFLQTLLDVLLVDDTDNDLSNGTPHSAAIISAFARHGISLASFIQLNLRPIADQDTSLPGYGVTVQVNYTGPFGAIDPKTLLLHCSTDGETFKTETFTKINDSTYGAITPKANAGTIVRYYASAQLAGDTSNTATSPAPSQPLSFAVGFRRTYFDDCESDRGWTLQDPSDLATTGLWVRAVPFGTYNVAGEYVQQDTDHSPGGTMCYVTGNARDPNIDVDDVDGGATTLTTDTIDLSGMTSPALRYWYYYTNDRGNAPGVPVWQTQISADDGATWKTLQQTNQSTKGWTGFLFRVSDYVVPSAHVRLRFIASDYVGAIVEAGIDDVEALSGPESHASNVVALNAANGFGIRAVRPNPAFLHGPLTIDYSLTSRSHVTLTIKDILGNAVAVLEDQMMEAGNYAASLSTAAIASGVYWVTLATPEAQSIRRIVIP
ncbi:MAG: hypothetical protein Q8922_13800 [Bacteroidota bacterium]|nr:hypothetical protein [Bacteroidota bacterium]MDP4232369.1 hypothetical protein [Bacteroidota bacterium]MDP4241506.1 hypothetical protein [Bacteroidota bacterium]MDP4288996.1 hypothetical protein [Bacteroidota bacterium]